MTHYPEYDPQGNQPAAGGPRRLTRRTDDAMLGGVCSGVAHYFNVDPNLVRLLTAVGALFSAGTILIVYIAAWLLLPES